VNNLFAEVYKMVIPLVGTVVLQWRYRDGRARGHA